MRDGFISGSGTELVSLFCRYKFADSSCIGERGQRVRSAERMRAAVVGAGVSGLVSAFVLAEAGVEVVLYEKEDYLGGHAKTVTFDGVDLDLGFMVFNRVSPLIFSYPSPRLLYPPNLLLW